MSPSTTRRRRAGAASDAPRLERAARGAIKETLGKAKRARKAAAPARSNAPLDLPAPAFVASKLELWPIERLRPLDRNPRVHSDQQVDEIAASISRFGFLVPVIVHRKERRILAGNGRYAAALRLGLKKVPVVVADHLSPALRNAYVIADNEIALHASWDDAILAEYFRAIERGGVDPTVTAFTTEDIKAILAADEIEETPEEEFVPPLPKRAVSKRGDLWTCGNHRVLCGDATLIDDVKLVVGKGEVQCVWTDPPYGVSYATAAGAVTNDDLPERELAALVLASLSAAHAVLQDGGAIYVAHADTAGLIFRQAFVDSGFRLSSVLIWRKDRLVLSRGDYHWQHEPILYGWKPGGSHRWYGNRSQTTIAEFDAPPFQQVDDHAWQINLGETTLLVRGRGLTVEQLRGTVLLEERPSQSRLHPTMKPVALIERTLGNSTRPGHVVLDPFGGSGSTLIACEQTGRRARLIDVEPKYVDVIVQRWQNLTGKAATIASTGRTFDQVATKRKRGE